MLLRVDTEIPRCHCAGNGMILILWLLPSHPHNQSSLIGCLERQHIKGVNKEPWRDPLFSWFFFFLMCHIINSNHLSVSTVKTSLTIVIHCIVLRGYILIPTFRRYRRPQSSQYIPLQFLAVSASMCVVSASTWSVQLRPGWNPACSTGIFSNILWSCYKLGFPATDALLLTDDTRVTLG